MAEYLGRPARIEAVHWTGDEVPMDLWDFAPGKIRHTSVSGPAAIELLAGKDGAQGWVPVPVGHWLVKNPGDDSDIWPVDPDYFAEKYRPVTEGPTEAPQLGLATTRQLLAELTTRIEVDYHAGGGGLDYSTVKGRPDGMAADDPASRRGLAIEAALTMLKTEGGPNRQVLQAAIEMLERASR